MKSPEISAAMEKKHRGKVVISLNGKPLGFGKDATDALMEAKKVMPDIEEKEFCISRIRRYKYFA